MVNKYTTVRITTQTSKHLDQILLELEDEHKIDISKGKLVENVMKETDLDQVRKSLIKNLQIESE